MIHASLPGQNYNAHVEINSMESNLPMKGSKNSIHYNSESVVGASGIIESETNFSVHSPSHTTILWLLLYHSIFPQSTKTDVLNRYRFRRHNFDLRLSPATCPSHNLRAIVAGFWNTTLPLLFSSCMQQSWGSCEVDLHKAIRVVWMTWASCMRQS